LSEQTRTFCSILSQQAGEALFATATPTQVYLLLEYRGNWGEKAVEESDLPETVKTYLSGFAKSQPAAKLMLIKGHTSAQSPSLRFFVADLHQQAVYEFRLEQYEDVLGLDFAAILDGAEQYQANRCLESLFLVCTNGRRDLCCSKFGSPVFEAMHQAARLPPAVQAWQVTHQGGHRFAPNVLVLPHGLLYGRVQPQDVPALREAEQRGEVLLERLRGNTAYSLVAQAAEYYLRQQTGDLNFNSFRLLDEQAEGEQQWRVRFAGREHGKIHSLIITLQKSEAKVYESCMLDKTTSFNRFHLLSYELLHSPTDL
jgi:hypothetical protein